MGSRVNQKITILGVIPRWWKPSNLDTSGTTVADPRPGLAVSPDKRSRAVVVASGGQGAALDLLAVRAGMPGREPGNAGSLVWAPSGSSSWRGVQSYGHLLDRVVLGDVAAIAEQRAHALCPHPDGRRLTAVYAHQETSDTLRTIKVRLLIVDTDGAQTWGAEVDVGNAGSVNDLCAVYLPSGRLIVWYRDLTVSTGSGLDAGWRSRYSDDAGATWATYSSDLVSGFVRLSAGQRNCWTDASAGNRASVALVGDALVMCRSTASGTLQAVSYTLGASWETVYASTAVVLLPSVVALQNGMAAIVGTEPSVSYPSIWRLRTPRQSIADVTRTNVDPSLGSATSASGWVEPSGEVYIVSTFSGTGEFWVSYDHGATWEEAGRPTAQQIAWHRTASGTGVPRAVSVCASGGRVHILASASDAAGTEGVAAVAYMLGGWSMIEDDAASTAFFLRTYLAHDLPTQVGWTAVGTAGVESITNAGLSLVPTGAQTRYYQISTGNTDNDIVVCFTSHITAGTGSVSSSQHGILMTIGDGVDIYRAALRFSSTQIRILDNTATIDTVNVDTTTPVVIWGKYTKATREWKAYWSRPGSSLWTLIGAGTLTGSASAVATNIQWGKLTSSTVAGDWRFFWYFQQSSATPDRIGTALLSRPLPGVGALPIPGYGEAPQALRLSGQGGPIVQGQTWDLDPTADRPAAAVMPQVSPSPRRGHRSAAETEQIWSWDLVDGGAVGRRIPEYIGIAVLQCNWATAVVETWDGSVWTARGTIDLTTGFLGLDGTATATTLRPASGVAAARYIQRGELVGGSVDYGGGVVRKITRCKEGVWNSTAGAFRRAQVDHDVDSGQSGGVVATIRHHSGVMLIHDLNLTVRAIRVRIPAQSTYNDTIDTGKIVIFEALAAGYAWGWGQVRSRELNRSVAEDGSLVTRVFRRGPTRREWTVDWTDGADQTEFRQAAPSPDWLSPGPTPSEPLANLGDLSILEALPDETLSGELPIVCVSFVPAASGVTITDPTLWLYGRLTSAPEVSHVVGDEGSNEYIRVGSVTVQEIP